jgi:hypothetical protein
MELPLRIVWLRPLAGVKHAVQVGRDELLAPSVATRERLEFEFTVRVGPRVAGEPPNFLGPYAQGARGERFVYVNSGRRAGQLDTAWDRRAKVWLDGITWELIDAALAKRGARLEAHVDGVGRDGGPTCASVRPAPVWKLASAARTRRS